MASEPTDKSQAVPPILEEGQPCDEDDDLVVEGSHRRDRDEKPNMYDMMREKRYEERRKRALEKYSKPY